MWLKFSKYSPPRSFERMGAFEAWSARSHGSRTRRPLQVSLKLKFTLLWLKLVMIHLQAEMSLPSSASQPESHRTVSCEILTSCPLQRSVLLCKPLMN